MLKDKISFSLEGSIIDLNTQQVPNFKRSSPVAIEHWVNSSLQLHPVPAYQPAFFPDSGAFLIEPEGINLLSWNMDLTKSVWLKGSNVIVFPDEVPSPDGSRLADRVIFAGGTGSTQLLKRSVALDAGTTYCLSAILQIGDAQTAASSDCIRVTGSVTATRSVSLTALNDYPNRYRLLSLTFTTSGRQPTFPKYSHSPDLSLSSVSDDECQIAFGTPIAAGALVGGRLRFSSSSTLYEISANTASSGASHTATLTLTSSLTGSPIASGNKVYLINPAPKECAIELYVESTLALNFGGIQLEAKPFRTSTIYQDDKLTLRSKTFLAYRRSPLQGLKNFGVFIDLKDFRGEGNIFSTNNFKLSIISSNRLSAIAGGTTLTTDGAISTNSKIFVQYSDANSSLSLYVNGVLLKRSTLAGFVGDKTSSLDLTSNGVRAINRLFVLDEVLLDGNVAIGALAVESVGELFSKEAIIDSVAISANAPLVVLPPVTVSAIAPAIAKSTIVGVNSSTRQVTVLDGSDFVLNADCVVTRSRYTILRSRIDSISGNVLTLNSIGSALVGDTITIVGTSELPGYASVRFPFTPIDEQVISSVSLSDKRIKVGSSLSFTTTRAIVRTPLYQDVAEVLILAIDNSNGYLYLNSVDGIAAGHVISQVLDEMAIDPPNYLHGLLVDVDGVKIASKYNNGIGIENYNLYPVQVKPFIRPLGY